MLTTPPQLIWANLQRRRLRTAVTTGGVALAVAAVFALFSFQRAYQSGMKADLDRLGAHLLIVPKGCPYDAASLALHGASWPCYLKSAYLGTVRATPHVAVAAPVLMTASYDPTGGQVVYCGVEPSFLKLRPNWRMDGHMCAQPGEVVVGGELARARGWRVGQGIALPGIAGGRATVSGMLQPTSSADDLFVYLPIADAQRLFHRPGQLTHILVRLDDPENADQVTAALRGCDAGLDMNVVPMAHLFETIRNLVESTRLLLACVALVALLAAGAGVGNTILMAVSERTREIGVLRALGGSRSFIFGLVWGETVALCLVGGVIGIGAVALGAGGIDAWLRAQLPFAPHDRLVQPEAGLILACLAGALVLGTLAAIAPATRASRLSPSAAIRSVGGDR